MYAWLRQGRATGDGKATGTRDRASGRRAQKDVTLPVLTDAHARRVTYLRVSLTDRCNYRCVYCMPEEGVHPTDREDVLTVNEIARIVRVFAGLGVVRVRLTGGEPTVRKDVVECVAAVAAIPGIRHVVMTSNGHILADLAARLADAGLTQVNVSLDTLDPDRFRRLTVRGDVARVMAGIDAARALMPVKINAVVLRGVNDDEIPDLCEWAWDRAVTPRFIEWMPLSDGVFYQGARVVSAAEIRARVEERCGPLVHDARSGVVGPARYWRVAGTDHKFGIISAMTEHFCDDCNRVRLTAAGDLHTCLAYDDATNLKALVRSGADDEAIHAAISAAVGIKRKGHGFTLEGAGAPKKHMVVVGG
ncbi:MAG TPA: GTP 3',8-cyclase MoaA [Haliangiales bacterium]|nr:GTP 3',8-cyclase MoaA [Haliangiales bacterium]